MNLKTWFERGPLACKTQWEADAWYEHQVECAIATGASRQTAEEVLREYIGYGSGYVPLAQAAQVYELFKVPHPVYGTPDERSRWTPSELRQIGAAFHLIARADTAIPRA